MYDHTEYSDVPGHILNALDRWGKDAVYPGGCLMAVLSNDLFGAVGRADTVTMQAMRKIVTYVTCQLPAGCRGSAATNWAGEG